MICVDSLLRDHACVIDVIVSQVLRQCEIAIPPFHRVFPSNKSKILALALYDHPAYLSDTKQELTTLAQKVLPTLDGPSCRFHRPSSPLSLTLFHQERLKVVWLFKKFKKHVFRPENTTYFHDFQKHHSGTKDF